MADTTRIRAAVRDVPNFPKPGILFKDVTPVLSDPALFHEAIACFTDALAGKGVEKIVGIDARGFIFGAATAHALGVGFVPIRKKGKLPWATQQAAYKLEYGEATVEIHADAVKAGERVALVDDLLATGGTAAAALKLLHQLNAEVVSALFLVELKALEGRKYLGNTPTEAFVVF